MENLALMPKIPSWIKSQLNSGSPQKGINVNMSDSSNNNRTFVVNGSQVNKNTAPETQATLAKYQFMYSVTGLFLGLAAIIGGIYLFVQGVNGASDWDIKLLGAESKIVQAAPGAILFIVGLFMVFVTRYKFKHIVAK